MAYREGFAVHMHKLLAMCVRDLEFRRDLEEIAICCAQRVPLEVLEVVVLVG